ncbi:unnamed protein product [Pleuronectes platessa]|uniref:Uncharacterized protein n=1 Tax=Pleuronectes platessa TaxID=8262 RepID=A0A9N7V8G8_PLEPL|nr:unnamed protein product [Pleuronectes platessa]
MNPTGPFISIEEFRCRWRRKRVKAQYKCRDCRAFQRDVSYLKQLLGKQRARGHRTREWTLNLCQALDEAHEKWAELQPLEESYCDTIEEIWQPEDGEEEGDWDEDTQQPEDCEEDSETLSATNILTETTKQNQETDLHKEVQEAYIIKQQMLRSCSLRGAQTSFLDELEKLRASNNEISQMYDAENLRAMQQASHL